MTEESIIKELIYWKNKAGQLALRVLELENNKNQETKLADMGTSVEVKDTPAHEKTNSSPDAHSTKQELNKEIGKDYNVSINRFPRVNFVKSVYCEPDGGKANKC